MNVPKSKTENLEKKIRKYCHSKNKKKSSRRKMIEIDLYLVSTYIDIFKSSLLPFTAATMSGASPNFNEKFIVQFQMFEYHFVVSVIPISSLMLGLTPAFSNFNVSFTFSELNGRKKLVINNLLPLSSIFTVLLTIFCS